MAKRNLPIGIEFYKKVIDEAYFYVDKTLIIKELLDRQSYVNLFTRPRRFGKTLALDMLKTFFEDEIDEKGNAVDNSRYFADKKIMDAGNQYIQHMGRYPVIYLSFKSSKQADWDTTFWMIKKQIAEEYIRHQYVLQTDDLLEVEKNLYRNIMSLADDNKIYVDAISFLSKCLERYHHQKVVILIDEYDVPLENAYFAGFYDEMTVFIRSLMESALKTNESLKLAVITGCLRISKESIFTGLNNLNVISVISDSFAEYFGFTESEVADMLEYYELEDKAEDIKKWYDGYLFGQTHVYNPWSVISYLNGVIADRIT
ncbi:MAG: AAA family ATPase, partial [Lachnospiraceae bacterium]|nr:AAA family ATPase [Lachnospiraceae bacterium]